MLPFQNFDAEATMATIRGARNAAGISFFIAAVIASCALPPYAVDKGAGGTSSASGAGLAGSSSSGGGAGGAGTSSTGGGGKGGDATGGGGTAGSGGAGGS